MKLKSKLIATIVSICAAIAVMGVGVWAASGSFNVTVENTINLAFASLDGTVTVSTASAQVGATGVSTVEELDEETLYAPDNEEADNIGKIDASVYEGVAFFDSTKGYISGKTTAATLQYIFTYTASDSVSEGAAYVGYSVTDIASPEGKLGDEDAFTTTYYITTLTDGAVDGWVEMAHTGTAGDEETNAFYVDAATDVQIMAVCEYSNPDAASIKAVSAWNFTVNMVAASGDIAEDGTAEAIDYSSITIEAAAVNATAGNGTSKVYTIAD